MSSEQKLGLATDERTRFKVRVSITEGRDPVRPETLWIRGAHTLEACQRLYASAREASGLGGSQFSPGEVFDEQGQYVARISYNGRLWPTEPWFPGMGAIAEAPRGEA